MSSDMGGDPARFDDPRAFAWLRDLGRRGVSLAGVSGGAYALARAGLLDGRRCTVHWEHRPAFTEAFPNIEVSPGLFVIDGPTMSCAGGVAALDMVIELIARRDGHDLAAAVGEWFIRAQPRSGSDLQRASLADRYGTANDKVLKALALMEETLEEPAPRTTLARAAGVGVRQLERLFIDELGQGVARVYRRLRLERARRLLRETSMSLVEAAVACGFSDAASFSRAYVRTFGRPPGRDRRLSHGGRLG